MRFVKQFEKLNKIAKLKLIDNIGLNNKYKEILKLRYIEEMSIYEIADKYGYTYDTVKLQIYKARKALEEIIEFQSDLLSIEIKEIINNLKTL